MSDPRKLAFTRRDPAAEQPDWLAADQTSIRPLAFPVRGAGPGPEPPSPPRRTAPHKGRVSSLPPPPRSERPPPPVLRATPPPGSHSKLPPPPSLHGPHAQLMLEVEARMRAFSEAALDLATARARALQQVEAELLDLAVEIAEAILQRELALQPSAHAELARAALAALGDPANACLRASREAYGAILESVGEPVLDIDGVRVRVQLDPAIEGLGCIAENDRGRVDSRLSERLRAVRLAFDDERHVQASETLE